MDGKKTYEKPILKIHGNLIDITQKVNGSTDSQNTKPQHSNS